jgi:hypothetical protein
VRFVPHFHSAVQKFWRVCGSATCALNESTPSFGVWIRKSTVPVVPLTCPRSPHAGPYDCPNLDPLPAFVAACSHRATASLPAPGSPPSPRTSPSSRRSCASILLLPAPHPRPLAPLRGYDHLRFRVPAPRRASSPFLQRNHIQFRAESGEQVRWKSISHRSFQPRYHRQRARGLRSTRWFFTGNRSNIQRGSPSH